ncbi:DUF3231 family protein [Natronospora cellulosivora (SeqCode)]
MDFSKLKDSSLSILKKSTEQEGISAIEAYNIWRTLNARYNSILIRQFFVNFVHDRELELLISSHLSNFFKQTEELEQMAKKYKVQVPNEPAENIKVSAQIDAITDKYIFTSLYNDLLAEIFSLSHAMISNTFNDELRTKFNEYVNSHIDDYIETIKLAKVKSWLNIAPSYKTYKAVDKEQVSTNEAVHLWDHINLRYDQLQMTKIYDEFVHDSEFKIIIGMGKKILNKQIKLLVELANKFEVVLPEKPPAVHETKIDPETFSDQFIFRVIYKGIQDAVDLHIRTIINSMRNDNLRNIFYDFYLEEMKTYHRMTKYGKLKGWTHVPPSYIS